MAKKRISEVPALSESEYRAAIFEFRLPRYHELPQLDLYMDQMISYIGVHVDPILPTDDKGLTAYMVNNYVKQGIVPKPKTKRYRPEHVAYIIVVTIMKQSFSFTKIMQLIQTQISLSDIAHAYDLFCMEFEAQLRSLFCAEKVETPAAVTAHRRLLIATVTSIANKIYAERMLTFIDFEAE